MVAVSFQHVDIIFGNQPKRALELLDQGADRQQISDETGHILGAADATLDIAAGEICVLMGLSGSGKSTLLRAVNGLNTVTRGQLLVEYQGKQIDVAHCDQRTLRQLRTEKIAMVFQQFALLPWRTVRDNVGLGLELKGMAKKERQAIVEEKLRLVGLEQWADKYSHELSGGMQQRVGLARAFATDADILLMDEPFSALDPLIRDKLQDELLELQRTLQKTIIFVSHDLDEALKIGSHIAIMEGGRIVQYGKPEEIVLNPASDYVAEFVAHMNPLNVLRAESLMQPLAALSRDGRGYWLDETRQCRLHVDDAGMMQTITVAGDTVHWIDYASYTAYPKDERPVAVVLAPPDILMREVIDIRHQTGLPLLLQRDNKLVGVISDAEIYQGLLRQTHQHHDQSK